MQYLGNLHYATCHPPKSSRGAAKILKRDYGLSDADKLLGYNHNKSNYKTFGKYTYMLDIPKGSWMKTINSSTSAYPSLLKKK